MCAFVTRLAKPQTITKPLYPDGGDRVGATTGPGRREAAPKGVALIALPET